MKTSKYVEELQAKSVTELNEDYDLIHRGEGYYCLSVTQINNNVNRPTLIYDVELFFKDRKSVV